MTDAIIQHRVRIEADGAQPAIGTAVASLVAGRPALRAVQNMLGALTYHHLGVVVSELDIARELYSVSLGVNTWETRNVAGPVIWRGRPALTEGIRVAFGRLGSSLIELVEPGPRPSVVRDVLTRRGEGIFSICYQVDDLRSAVRNAEAFGCLVEQISPDADNPQSVYLDAGSGLLLELIPNEVSSDG